MKYKNGYVYVIKNEHNKVKIGKSLRPKKRIYEITRMGCIKIIEKYITEKLINYGEFELFLHQRFKNNRIVGEWFSADFVKIVSCVKENAHIFNIVPLKTISAEQGQKPSGTRTDTLESTGYQKMILYNTITSIAKEGRTIKNRLQYNEKIIDKYLDKHLGINRQIKDIFNFDDDIYTDLLALYRITFDEYRNISEQYNQLLVEYADSGTGEKRYQNIMLRIKAMERKELDPQQEIELDALCNLLESEIMSKQLLLF